MNMNFRKLPVIDRVLIATLVVLAVVFLAVSSLAYADDAGPATSTKDAHGAAGNCSCVDDVRLAQIGS